jgi:hypothetical protein
MDFYGMVNQKCNSPGCEQANGLLPWLAPAAVLMSGCPVQSGHRRLYGKLDSPQHERQAQDGVVVVVHFVHGVQETLRFRARRASLLHGSLIGDAYALPLLLTERFGTSDVLGEPGTVRRVEADAERFPPFMRDIITASLEPVDPSTLPALKTLDLAGPH